MNLLAKNQTLLVQGGTIRAATNAALFYATGATAGFFVGPYLMPLLKPDSDSFASGITNFVIDYKAGEYGLHSKSDVMGALVGSFVGSFAGSIVGGAIS